MLVLFEGALGALRRVRVVVKRRRRRRVVLVRAFVGVVEEEGFEGRMRVIVVFGFGARRACWEKYWRGRCGDGDAFRGDERSNGLWN